MISDREISARELLEAHLTRIDEVNPRLNAIVTLDRERARREAEAADAATAAGTSAGPLHGLPMAHKDLANTAGMRTTFGSPLFADHVPDFDDAHVAVMRAAGGVTVGKTNTPEFGAGSQTFNEVFGATRNPWDDTRTCGGSSGGAAVALATGMVAVADGSDMGGSLRNPAAFCGIVGLRPTPGRVGRWPVAAPWSPWGVMGPMGRTVADVRLLLDAMSVHEPRDPLHAGAGRAAPGETAIELRELRAAVDIDLGGLPLDPSLRAATRRAIDLLTQHGLDDTGERLDLHDAGDVFQVMRAAAFESGYGAVYDREPEALKDTVRWNVAEARRRPLADMGRAIATQGRLHTAATEFFERHDVMVTATTQVPPFDLDTEWVTEIDGVGQPTYIDWMRSCSDITVLGCPAISIPAGTTDAGLPVGLQLVTGHGGESHLLRVAELFETVLTDAGLARPWALPS